MAMHVRQVFLCIYIQHLGPRKGAKVDSNNGDADGLDSLDDVSYVTGYCLVAGAHRTGLAS